MLYIIRHAQSQANAGGNVLYDNRHIPLTDYGHQQAQKLITSLPRASKVYVSEMLRTQQSALPFCQHWGITWEVLPELNEFSYLPFSLIEGKSRQMVSELARQYFERQQIHERYGEDSFYDFYQRVARFRAQAKRFEADTVCFGHGVWLQMFYWQSLGKALCDLAHFRAFQSQQPIENASIHVFSL
ncbi:MAG: histidine phosphatase family protein [Cardiobacteriaceae bacterium]|nr:histidine phosphatase family protein [Cardiobacteriaceae bacterium]